MKIAIERVIPNRFNPNSLSQDQYELLRTDISEHGLEYPIEVRPLENGTYEIIDGEHRWKACKELGFRKVECEVKDISEAEAKQRNYRLNSARGTIDPLKEAQLFKSEIESGMTQQQVAEKYGRSQQFISSRIILLRLPDEVKEAVTTRVVKTSQAEILAETKDPEIRRMLYQKAKDQKASVKELIKEKRFLESAGVEDKHYLESRAVLGEEKANLIRSAAQFHPDYWGLQPIAEDWNLSVPELKRAVKAIEEFEKGHVWKPHFEIIREVPLKAIIIADWYDWYKELYVSTEECPWLCLRKVEEIETREGTKTRIRSLTSKEIDSRLRSGKYEIKVLHPCWHCVYGAGWVKEALKRGWELADAHIIFALFYLPHVKKLKETHLANWRRKWRKNGTRNFER